MSMENQPNETLPSIGTVLASARHDQDLDQREVSLRLNIPIATVEALEQDRFDRLGAPVFVRSYLTRYARLLGLPEQQIEQRYRQLGQTEQPPIPLKVTRTVKPQTRIRDIRWLYYPVAVAVVVWFGWIGTERLSDHLAAADDDTPTLAVLGGSNSTTRIALPGQPPLPVVEPSPVISFSPTAIPAAMADQTEQIADAVAAAAPLPPTAASQPATAGQSNEPDTVPETLAAAQPEPDVDNQDTRLKLVFSDDCWVEVTDAQGKRLAYGMMRADSSHQLIGEAPFSMTLGNANAAEIILNGNPVAESVYRPTRGTVSRFSLDINQG